MQLFNPNRAQNRAEHITQLLTREISNALHPKSIQSLKMLSISSLRRLHSHTYNIWPPGILKINHKRRLLDSHIKAFKTDGCSRTNIADNITISTQETQSHYTSPYAQIL